MNGNGKDSRSQGHDENTPSRINQLLEVIYQEGAERDREHPESRPNASEKPRRTNNHLILRTYVHWIVEKVIQEAFENLDERVIDIAEHTVVDVLETGGLNRHKAFIKTALRCAF